MFDAPRYFQSSTNSRTLTSLEQFANQRSQRSSDWMQQPSTEKVFQVWALEDRPHVHRNMSQSQSQCEQEFSYDQQLSESIIQSECKEKKITSMQNHTSEDDRVQLLTNCLFR